MNQSFTVDFKMMVGDRPRQWVSVDTLLGKASALVDGYLQIENLRCGHFQGGFFITVDGEPWSDDGTVDEFWMTTTWFPALKKLLDGHRIAHATPWEESNLRLERFENEITLEDIHSSGFVSMQKITLPFFEFAKEMIQQSEKFATLVSSIRNEIHIRRVRGISAEMDVKLNEIEHNLPHEIELEQAVQMLLIKLKTMLL